MNFNEIFVLDKVDLRSEFCWKIVEQILGPTISENSFKYDSTNKRLEAVITDNLSGVKDVLFTQKETVNETDWSTASQYYEKDTVSDKYYSKNMIIIADIYFCFSRDFSYTNCVLSRELSPFDTLVGPRIARYTVADRQRNKMNYPDYYNPGYEIHMWSSDEHLDLISSRAPSKSAYVYDCWFYYGAGNQWTSDWKPEENIQAIRWYRYGR